jgi:hypothetical protein
MEYLALAGLGALAYVAYGQIMYVAGYAAYNPGVLQTRSDTRSLKRMMRPADAANGHQIGYGCIPSIPAQPARMSSKLSRFSTC